MSKTILLSQGINTITGYNLLQKVISGSEQELTSIMLIAPEFYELDNRLIAVSRKLGFKNIYTSNEFLNKKEELPDVQFVYVCDGNTFEIIKYMRMNLLDEYVQKQVSRGATYIGASAGAILASEEISYALSYDANHVGVINFDGLGLLPDSRKVYPHRELKEMAMKDWGIVPQAYIDGHKIGDRELIVIGDGTSQLIKI